MKKVLFGLAFLMVLTSCTSPSEEATKGVDFYDTNINNSSTSRVELGSVYTQHRVIILKNKSDAQVTETFTLTKGTGFEVTNGCGTGNIQLPSNGSCSVTISFNPENVVGTQTVVLTFGVKRIEIVATGIGKCDDNTHFDSAANTCISNTRACEFSNGTGTQDYTNGVWGTCRLVACSNGYENIQGRCRPACSTGYHRDVPPPGDPGEEEGREGGGIVYTYNCIRDVISCEVLPNNALQATRTWNGSAYNDCEIQACMFNYHLSSGVCEYNVKDCEGANGATGFSKWINNQWNECTINACPSDFHIEANSCLSNSRPCTDPSGGAGRETWNQVAWGSCVLDRCLLDGYHVESNLCKPNFRACSLQELSAFPFAIAGRAVWKSGESYDCEIFACSNANLVVYQNRCVDKETAPSQVTSIKINDNKTFTNSLTITLSLGYDTATLQPPIEMKLSNDQNCSGGAWENFSYDKTWTLANRNTANFVSVQFRGSNGSSACLTQSITHDDIVPQAVLEIQTPNYDIGNNIILNLPTLGKLSKPFSFSYNRLPQGLSWYMGDSTDANLQEIQVALGSGVAGDSIKNIMDWKKIEYSVQPISFPGSPQYKQVFYDSATEINSPLLAFDRSYYVSLRLLDKAGNISPVYTSRFSYQLINGYFKFSCDDLLQSDPSLRNQDGVYLVDPDGFAGAKSPRAVFCDMTNKGGGWTKIAHELAYKYPGGPEITSYSRENNSINVSCPEGTYLEWIGGRYYTNNNFCSVSPSADFLSTLTDLGGDIPVNNNFCLGSAQTLDPDPGQVKDAYVKYRCVSGAAAYNASFFPYRAEDRGCHNADTVSDAGYNIWACQGGSYNCGTFCHNGDCAQGIQAIFDRYYGNTHYLLGWEYTTGDIRAGCRGAYVYGIRVKAARKKHPWLVIDDQGIENYTQVWINARGSSNYASLDPYASTGWKADGWAAKRNLIQLGDGGFTDSSDTWYWDQNAADNPGCAGILPIDLTESVTGPTAPRIVDRWGTVSDCRYNGVQYGSNGRACTQNVIVDTRGLRIKRISDIESVSRSCWGDNSYDQILNIYVK